MRNGAKLIFDWSGTISNDFDIVFTAINKVFLSYGKQPITRFDIMNLYSSDAHFLWRFYGLPSKDANEKFLRYLKEGNDPEPIPGAIEIVNKLVQEFPTVILTTHPQHLVEREAKRYGLADCVLVGDVSKVHPCESLERQIEGMDRRKVIYVGDTAVDIHLARSYQLLSIALAHRFGYHNKRILEEAQPQNTINSLEELPLLVHKILGEAVAN